jgi:hypothetical protein
VLRDPANDVLSLPVAAAIAYKQVFSTRPDPTARPSTDELDLESRHRLGVVSQLTVKKSDLEQVLQQLKIETT